MLSARRGLRDNDFFGNKIAQFCLINNDVSHKSAIKVAGNRGANAMKPVNDNESTIVTVVFVNNTRSIYALFARAQTDR
jgi:hypothetical protein